MVKEEGLQRWREFDALFRAHPWHGVSIGEDAPDVVNVYVEIVPTDVVKYELDKVSGYLRVDRPQKYSSQCPALYGFVPQTYCGDRVGARSAEFTGKPIPGDGDPLDICILAERPIEHGDILLKAIPIGGFEMVDGSQADDKVIAVLFDDSVYGGWRDISECPKLLVERLQHYFLTYKDIPGKEKRRVELSRVYGGDEARKVIALSREDYLDKYRDVAALYGTLTGGGE